MFPRAGEGLQDDEGREVPQFPQAGGGDDGGGDASTAVVVAARGGGGKPPRRYLRVGAGATGAGGGGVTVLHAPPDRVVLSWVASPTADMVADALVALIAQAEVSQAALRASSTPCAHGGHGGGEPAGDEGGAAGCGHDHHDHARHPSAGAGAGEGDDSPAAGGWTGVAAGVAGDTPAAVGAGPRGGSARADDADPHAHVHALGDLLLATLCEQYGPERLRYEGPHHELVCAAFPGVAAGPLPAPPAGGECGGAPAPDAAAGHPAPDGDALTLTVELDGVVGRVSYAHGGGEEGGEGGWTCGVVGGGDPAGVAAGKLAAALRHTLAFARAAFAPGGG